MITGECLFNEEALSSRDHPLYLLIFYRAAVRAGHGVGDGLTGSHFGQGGDDVLGGTRDVGRVARGVGVDAAHVLKHAGLIDDVHVRGHARIVGAAHVSGLIEEHSGGVGVAVGGQFIGLFGRDVALSARL